MQTTVDLASQIVNGAVAAIALQLKVWMDLVPVVN